MKIEKLMKRLIYSVVLLVTVMASCKKSADQTTPPDITPSLEISAVTPDSGAFFKLVNITGKGFSANPGDNKVKFNGKDAEVKEASPERLVVKVPKGAGDGAITVQLNGNTAKGPSFNYIETITVSTLAGNGKKGFVNGTGTEAQFYYPRGLAVDARGNVYVADAFNYVIRKITPAGVVSTYAGTGEDGHANGRPDEAQFYFPSGVAFDKNDNLYVADAGNNMIRKINTSGFVSTLAGQIDTGFLNGTGTAAKFDYPSDVAVDAQGTVYVADMNNHSIRTITPAGVVKILAGNGSAGYVNAKGTQARFTYPYFVSVDAKRIVYVMEFQNTRIRKINSSTEVSTLTGTAQPGFLDGPLNKAMFNAPYGIGSDAAGNLYVADSKNARIRKISPSGIVSTLAIPNTAFKAPVGIAIDAKGIIYVADEEDHRIRKILIE